MGAVEFVAGVGAARTTTGPRPNPNLGASSPTAVWRLLWYRPWREVSCTWRTSAMPWAASITGCRGSLQVGLQSARASHVSSTV